MRHPISAAVRKVVLPTFACSLVCGGAVLALATTGVHALESPAALEHPAGPLDLPPGLPPPAAVVVRTPPAPAVTDAPTAVEWVVRLPAPGH